MKYSIHTVHLVKYSQSNGGKIDKYWPLNPSYVVPLNIPAEQVMRVHAFNDILKFNYSQCISDPLLHRSYHCVTGLHLTWNEKEEETSGVPTTNYFMKQERQFNPIKYKSYGDSLIIFSTSWKHHIIRIITQTRLCNILQYFTAVKKIIFRWKLW